MKADLLRSLLTGGRGGRSRFFARFGSGKTLEWPEQDAHVMHLHIIASRSSLSAVLFNQVSLYPAFPHLMCPRRTPSHAEHEPREHTNLSGCASDENTDPVFMLLRIG